VLSMILPVVAADGTVMHGLSLIYVLRDLQGIREFKIVQESLEHVRVIIVPDDQWSESVESTIVDGFRARLGEDVKVEMVHQSEIKTEASGKRRYVVSHVLPGSATGGDDSDD
jgi:phenylacetate-CoA ligase